MKKLLNTIFSKAIDLKDVEFEDKQVTSKWCGTHPASDEEINLIENRLGLKLPKDYKELLKITNGFPIYCSVEPSFQNINDVDFYRNIENNTISQWDIKDLESAILVGGRNEEQQFFLIPPNESSKEWRYWKFANWIPGEEEFDNLTDYFNSVIEFMDEELNNSIEFQEHFPSF